jgi:hypothetical protein
MDAAKTADPKFLTRTAAAGPKDLSCSLKHELTGDSLKVN